MADITLLRNNAIVRNASVGTTPPHGPLKTGELPLVQVKMGPGGPQIQEGQQKPVTILPPRDAKSAVTTGGLPMVSVKMTQNGPQLEDGRDQPVLIREGKHGAVATGGLPMIQVKMDGGKPQVQNMPHVSGAGPQIPAAPPVLSAPRVQRTALPANQGYVATPTALATAPRHGYVARAAVPATSQVRIARVAAPQVALPPVPEFTTDQLMLCRHLADTYLNGLLAVEVPSEDSAEAPVVSEAIQLAKATLATIDDVLVSTAVRAEAAAIAEAAAAASPAPTIPTVAASASTSIAPTPSVAHVAGRVAGRVANRSYSMPGARSQRNNGMAPRATPRAGGPLPPVIVKMDGQKPQVQNQAEIAQARAALAEAQAAASVVVVPAPMPEAPSVLEAVPTDDAPQS
jgi:hypothetical protein